ERSRHDGKRQRYAVARARGEKAPECRRVAARVVVTQPERRRARGFAPVRELARERVPGAHRTSPGDVRANGCRDRDLRLQTALRVRDVALTNRWYDALQDARRRAHARRTRRY